MKLLNTIHTLSALTRAKDWRLSFVPFVMGCVYLWMVWFKMDFNIGAAVLVILSILTTVGFAALGYFINEFFDRQQDKKAGKINKMELLKPFHRFVLFWSILAFVFLPWFGLPSDRTSYILIGAEISLFLLYSLPFLRLKDSPYLAGIIDASYAYVVPLLLSYHTYSLYNKTLEIPLFLPFFMVSVFFVGYRNIAIHQVDDLFKDMRAGIITLPQVLGPKNTNRLMRWLMGLEMLFFLLAFFFLGYSHPSFWIWIPLFPLLVIFRIWSMDGDIGERFFCIKAVRHAPDAMYLIIFPLFGLLLLTIHDIYWGIFLLLHVLLLVPNYPLKWIYINVLKPSVIALRIGAGHFVNYTIYYFFRLFGVDLVKEGKSAMGYVKHKWFR